MFSPVALLAARDSVSPWSIPVRHTAFPMPHPALQDHYAAYKRLALAQLQPPRNPNKPYTSFFIRDILEGDGKGSRAEREEDENNERRSPVNYVRPWSDRERKSPESHVSSTPGSEDDVEVDIVDDDKPSPSCTSSPLDALLQMTSKTFEGLNDEAGHDEMRKDHLTIFSKSQPAKKRRKSRTAFTNQQIYELEKRFLYQKYLTPADRDEIAHQLGLTNAQVITWFQNRRAKLKRDLEELKADVNAAKSLNGVNGEVFGNLEELQFFQRYGLKKCDKKESS